MYHIVVCDDEAEWVDIISSAVEGYCKKNDIEVQIEKYNDSDLLMEHIEQGLKFNAYLLDIEMQTYSGMDIAKRIRLYSNDSYIIYLTSHVGYALEGYGLNVLRYILKEKLDKELDLALDELFMHLGKIENDKIYVIENQRRYIRVPHREIVRVYKSDKNAVLVLKNGTIEYERLSLKDVYQKMDNEDMAFFDRGNILNLSHVESISKGKIRMDDGFEIKATNIRIAEIKKLVNAYLRRTI